MFFCLSFSDTENRVILDDMDHGTVLAIINADSWAEARDAAEASPAMDPFNYRAGVGWIQLCPSKPPVSSQPLLLFAPRQSL
ncbi:hypothetical protein ABRZ00_12805 [Castellaniella ginsengisoli]|uniref:YCII-related domain-containing protein n=1 Tax=Castellaniella ginsengisoli TaxID=546114 RepID=A0AB39DMJ6_9BURK